MEKITNSLPELIWIGSAILCLIAARLIKRVRIPLTVIGCLAWLALFLGGAGWAAFAGAIMGLGLVGLTALVGNVQHPAIGLPAIIMLVIGYWLSYRQPYVWPIILCAASAATAGNLILWSSHQEDSMSLLQIQTIPDSVRMQNKGYALGIASVIASSNSIIFNTIALWAIVKGTEFWSHYAIWLMLGGLFALASASCIGASAGSFCCAASDDDLTIFPPPRLCQLSAYGCTTFFTNALSFIADVYIVALIAINGEASWGWAMLAIAVGLPAVPCAIVIAQTVRARTTFVQALS
jgi:hypothetical protein